MVLDLQSNRKRLKWIDEGLHISKIKKDGIVDFKRDRKLLTRIQI